jgi:hypothetical protein
VEDDSVGQVLAEAAAHFDRIERVFDALVWRLSHDPECGDLAPDNAGTQYRYWRALPLERAKNPTILAQYTVDNTPDVETVYINQIKIYPYDAAEAVSPKEFDI